MDLLGMLIQLLRHLELAVSNRYGAMLSVGELTLSKPRNVITRGRSPAGRPSGNLTMM